MTKLDRRSFLAYFTQAGLATTLLPGVLWAAAEKEQTITKAMINDAAKIAGLSFTDEQEQMMLDDLNRGLDQYKAIHDLKIPNSVAPAVEFNPVLPGMKFDMQKRPLHLSRVNALQAPKNIEDLAFASVRDLAELVRNKKVSSSALTEMYLERLKRYDPVLKFVITLTEDRARAQAKEADADIARGKYRGPLHGLPWGAKDLLAAKGYLTTWGAGGFEKQMIDEDATVVKRLDEAGAVLVAKLTLGALAMGDVWFGGTTKNPWKIDQGSSGSSAGPASATAAGCVAFSIGSETLGSISSPSTRCGATGLRPTFGRVPRTGAMALSWSMDKLGPICRRVEDCAIVLSAIYGPDGHDRTVHDIPFNWDATQNLSAIRVGWLQSDFEDSEVPKDEKPEQRDRRLDWQKFNNQALDVIRTKLGIKLTPVKLPGMPWAGMRPILLAEAAAAFDELTRSGRDKLLTAQGPNDWPNEFRVARFIPAVEYVNGNRARMEGMEKFADMFRDLDVIVAPTFSTQLLATNLTGHPALILPNGFRPDGTPTSLTFIGNLFGEEKLCAVARAYEQATDWHNGIPPLFKPGAPAPPVPPEKKS
jgi:Asp-tRNA(Asn)/Glu-tRNA(Gln) amidotransferase A subunit family amidase